MVVQPPAAASHGLPPPPLLLCSFPPSAQPAGVLGSHTLKGVPCWLISFVHMGPVRVALACCLTNCDPSMLMGLAIGNILTVTEFSVTSVVVSISSLNTLDCDLHFSNT